MKILLKGFKALIVDKIQENLSITIESGRIKKISEGEDSCKLNPKDFDKVIDGENKLVIPGFVNTHTHLAMVLFRGYADDLPLKRWLEEEIWPAERKLTAEDVYWASLLGIAEMIRSGTTTFADMYFYMDAVAKAVEESGIRAMLSYGMIAPKPGAKAKRELSIAQEFLEGFHRSAEGRITVALSPHAPYTCADSVWKRTVELARKYQVMIHTHLSETEDEVERFLEERDLSPAEYLDMLEVFTVPVLAAHCVHLNLVDIGILARNKVSVAHCPGSNMKMGSGIAPVSSLIESGVNVAIGTDGVASNNNLDMLEEIRLAALAQKGLLADTTLIPAEKALQMGTLCGARALGLENEIGTIAEGKKADLIIFNLDKPHLIPQYNLISNLVYAASAQDVETVIIEGRIVMENEEIKTFDEEEVKNRVKKLQEKYARRTK